MRTSWSPEELIDCWTLVEDNWRLVGNKTGATRLGFSVMLKYFELEGRFPEQAAEIVPGHVKLPAYGQVVSPLVAK